MKVRTVLAVLMGLLWSAVAGAQGRRIVIEETIIEGEIKKPEITIIITRQNLNTGYNLELKESFVPKIVESVEKEPF